jgi:hypothetical protein
VCFRKEATSQTNSEAPPPDPDLTPWIGRDHPDDHPDQIYIMQVAA